MNYSDAELLVSRYGQEHLLKYWNGLTDSEREELLRDIERTDFTVLDNLEKNNKPLGALSEADALSVEDIKNGKQEYEEAGLSAIRSGKVAAVLLAGGQGTRLGCDAPKGAFDIGLTKKLTIFEIQMNEIKRVAENAGRAFHLFVMTSFKNDGYTREFFEKNAYFGYEREKIHFYVQDVTPACSFEGKIFLEEKHRLALSPNGNGGWYSSLIKAGFGKLILKEGIEWLNVYAVDNVLQKICDPVFIGATLLSGCASSSKVVAKVSPEEKVGVLCKENGLPKVVEYYELPDSLKNMRLSDGRLKFRYGVILNYLFRTDGLNEIYRQKLPYHLAEKCIPHIEDGVKVNGGKPDGYKFETLVVDMVTMMGSCLAFEVEREKEFAPVKNKTGVDSVDSARALLIKNGINL